MIQRIETPSLEKQADACDFVELMASRKQGSRTAEWTEKDFSFVSMAQAMRDMEADPVSYSVEDIAAWGRND